MQKYPLDASLTLAEVAPRWLEQHKRYIKPNTLRNYKACLRILIPFIGEVLVKDIHIGHIRAYQAFREPTKNCVINGEVCILQMILKECGEWDRIKEFYKPMRVPKRRGGHSISGEEEQRLREVAFSRPKWRLAAQCMTVMLSTTMGFGELRHIRRRDVDTKRRCITVRDGAKNFYRDRTIPLNATAYDSMSWIVGRWERLGGSEDSEFILPHRPKVPGCPWIFTEPMKAITTAFNNIRKEAGLPMFRVYDCRVQAITKLLSDPKVSPQVSKEIAGHISQAMQDHYSIQQHDTKMAALEALEHPTVRPESEPTPPAKQMASADLIQPAIQAEIDRLRAEIARLADRQFALALREPPSTPKAPETHARRKRHSTKHPSGDPAAEVFRHGQSAKKLIAFPPRLA